MGAGSTMSRNDACHSAQYTHNAMMAAQRQAVRTTLGPDSQVASEGRHGGDSLFDLCARCVSGHLMLHSGSR
jgi:hypothetical protein